ncbi:MAG: DUF3352 domain-containing protein [Cyanobacteria bacterium P01_H01_bin.58]
MVFAKKPPLLLTVTTALLLIGAGVLAHWGIRWQQNRIRGLPAGVLAVPEQAAVMVSLSTHSDQWQQLRQFGTPETQAAFDQRLANWRDRWLTDYGLSFSRDLAPWIGPEVTIAWLPGPESETNANDSSAVDVWDDQRRILLLPIRDPEEAQNSAKSLFLPEDSIDTWEYRGVTLSLYGSPDQDGQESTWIGVLGTQLILVAEDQETAQQSIDAYKDGNSIANIAGYRRSFEHIGTAQAFGQFYADVPTAIQLLGQMSQPEFPAALVESFQDSQGLAATIALTSQGIQVKSTRWLEPDSENAFSDTNVAAQLPQYLPRDTLALASGGNFQQLWQDLSEQQNWGRLTAFDPENLTLAVQSSTGLTTEEDLLPWMGGEFALALVPVEANSSDTDAFVLPNPGLVVLMQVSDRPQAEQAFDQLDTVVKNRYRFSIVDEPMADIELIKWISPFQSTTLSRGWLESSIAFLTIGEATEDAIIPQPQRSLAKAPLFQLTTGEAPYPNNGYFYLNLEALSRTQNNLFIPDLSLENQGLLRAIQALGVTATVLDSDRLRYDLYLALTRGNRPGPLPQATDAPQ